MHRRMFLGVVATLVALPTAWAQPSGAARLVILRDLVEALGAAGDAIIKITDGFKHLVVTGVSGYNYVAAERERSRLIDISRRTANLIVNQNIRVIQSLDEYLQHPNPTDSDWQRVVGNINATLSSVRALLQDVQAENGDFVLEPAYLALNRTLSARSSLLQQLSSLPAPSSKEERNVLRQASDKYKVLIANAEQAIMELNAYVKSKK